MKLCSFHVAFQREDAQTRNTLLDVLRVVRRSGYRIERASQRGDDNAAGARAELYVEYVGAEGAEVESIDRIKRLLSVATVEAYTTVALV